MAQKLAFHETYGAEECYDFDPKKNRLRVYLRRGRQVRGDGGHGRVRQPMLGVRFDLTGRPMKVYHPNGSRFLSTEEADRSKRGAERRAAKAAAENERFRALFRQAGIDPDAAGT